MLPRINAQDSWRGGNGRAERIEAAITTRGERIISEIGEKTTERGWGDGGHGREEEEFNEDVVIIIIICISIHKYKMSGGMIAAVICVQLRSVQRKYQPDLCTRCVPNQTKLPHYLSGFSSVKKGCKINNLNEYIFSRFC